MIRTPIKTRSATIITGNTNEHTETNFVKSAKNDVKQSFKANRENEIQAKKISKSAVNNFSKCSPPTPSQQSNPNVTQNVSKRSTLTQRIDNNINAEAMATGSSVKIGRGSKLSVSEKESKSKVDDRGVSKVTMIAKLESNVRANSKNVNETNCDADISNKMNCNQCKDSISMSSIHDMVAELKQEIENIKNQNTHIHLQWEQKYSELLNQFNVKCNEFNNFLMEKEKMVMLVKKQNKSPTYDEFESIFMQIYDNIDQRINELVASNTNMECDINLLCSIVENASRNGSDGCGVNNIHNENIDKLTNAIECLESEIEKIQRVSLSSDDKLIKMNEQLHVLSSRRIYISQS